MTKKVTKKKEETDEQIFVQEMKRLRSIRNFKDAELDLLEEYARTRIQAFKLRIQVDQEGEVFVSDRGGSYMNPRAGILQNVLNRMDRLRDKLFKTDPQLEKEVKDIRDVL